MWSSLSAATKFSIIAFLVTLALGLLSMGALGYALYYLVKPILGNRIEELSSDAIWPTTIFAGMLWSFGFLIAALALYYLKRYSMPTGLHYPVYLGILWLWILLIWWWLIEFEIVK